MLKIDWQPIRLVVFDVDGTLYDQRRLRRKMLMDLALHCLRHPGEVRILRQISEYRRCREELAEEEATGITSLQYRRPAERLGVDPDGVRQVVEDWMLHRPLSHLRSCRYANVAGFMSALTERGISIGVLSDYPARDKLGALDLQAEWTVSATDPEVDRLKPHPKGMLRILELTGMARDQIVLIGDRDDRDGECARRAGVAYLIRSANPPADGCHFGDFAELVSSLHRNPAEDAALQ
jgi:HAD superfamily hydrolase (TIGR01549 family)